MNRKLFVISVLVFFGLTIPLFAQASPSGGQVIPGGVSVMAPENELDAPENYGTQDWIITWLPASAFQPRFSDVTHGTDTATGYMYRTAGADEFLWAPVSLPNGALLDIMRLFVCDSDATDATMWLTYYDGATVPAALDIGPASTTGTPGCTTVALTGMNQTIDIGGTSNDRSYVVHVGLPATTSALSFKGVRLAWHRQITPAPATATFSDVPTTHLFFQHIEALAASGITLGCGAGIYCPDATLTRGQMAAFLSRSLGLHWPY